MMKCGDLEVRSGELAEVVEGGSVVGDCGLLGRGEISKRQEFVVHANSCGPRMRLPTAIPNTSIARLVVCVKSSVGCVLSAGTEAKIGPPVVEGIAVDMVNLLAGLRPKNDPVHKDVAAVKI